MTETHRVVLRKLDEKDINDLVESGNDYDVHYNSFFLMKYPFGEKEALEVINEDKNSKNMKRFGIELIEAPVLHSCHSQESSSAGGKIIGIIDLYNINLKNKKLKWGCWIGKKYRRKGYADEATKKLIKYAFKNYAVDEIIATTLTSNEPSMNMLLKNNFVKGNILKNDRLLDDKYVDSVQFVLKREDYFKNKQT